MRKEMTQTVAGGGNIQFRAGSRRPSSLPEFKSNDATWANMVDYRGVVTSVMDVSHQETGKILGKKIVLKALNARTDNGAIYGATFMTVFVPVRDRASINEISLLGITRGDIVDVKGRLRWNPSVRAACIEMMSIELSGTIQKEFFEGDRQQDGATLVREVSADAPAPTEGIPAE